MINLCESIGPGLDQTRDPSICSQIRIYSQTLTDCTTRPGQDFVVLKSYTLNLYEAQLKPQKKSEVHLTEWPLFLKLVYCPCTQNLVKNGL